MPIRTLNWIGGAKKDYTEFPVRVQRRMGYALHLAQIGEMPDGAKPLKGFGGAGVIELIEDFDGNTYRAVYTVRFASGIYVLHAFQKKSRHGIKTNKDDIELIRRRLLLVEARHRN